MTYCIRLNYNAKQKNASVYTQASFHVDFKAMSLLTRVPATAHDVTLCAVQTTARPSKWGIKLAMNQIIVAQPEFLEQIVQVMAVFVVVGTRQFSL